MNDMSEFKVKGHRGKWYIIDTTWYRGRQVHLCESATYGDEVANIIVEFLRNTPVIVMEDVWNGFNDLELM